MIDIKTIAAIVGIIVGIVSIVKLFLSHKSKKFDRERPKVIERLKLVFEPFIKKLEIQIMIIQDIIRNKKFRRCCANIENLEPSMDRAEFKKMYPQLSKQIEKHNQLVKELKDSYKNLFSVIKKDHKDDVLQLIEQFKEQRPSFSGLKEDVDRIITYIINGNSQNTTLCWEMEFWKIYGDKLLKIKDHQEVKEQFQKVDSISTKLLNVAINLEKNLKTQKEKEINKYSITHKERIS